MTDCTLDSVIYISTARPDLSMQDFSDIIAASQRKNATVGITGILCFNGTNFMQLLEGERELVNDRLLFIGSDKRHNGMVTVKRRSINKREFPDWGMAGSAIHIQGGDTVQKLTDLLAIDSVSAETREIFNNFGALGHGV